MTRRGVDTGAARRGAHAESVKALAAGPKHHWVGDTGLLSRRRGVVELVDSIVVQNCRTEAQCDSFLTDTALNCTKLH